jgi:hypothetical protein
VIRYVCVEIPISSVVSVVDKAGVVQQGELPKDEIEAVMRELQAIHQRSGASSLVAVCGVILPRFFGGSAQAWAVPQRDRRHSLPRIMIER